jgi:acetylornithine deacetylase
LKDIRTSSDFNMKSDLLQLASGLVSVPSVSGSEFLALEFLCEEFESYGWRYEKIPVSENRYNIFVTFGSPLVCFSTHIDVVPGEDHLFRPVISEGRLIGRGACDAKGILASMICAIKSLEADGQSNFALLVVVGEETDGTGAKVAAEKLKGRGIRYLINGEPTECKLVTAHKGGIDFHIQVRGVSCHSGYPEYGVDANRILIELADCILKSDFGSDPVLGKATVNIGQISGGTASNVVSDHADIHGEIRVVTDIETVTAHLESILGDKGQLTIKSSTPRITLKTLPGFEETSVAYATDIPNFLPLEAEYLLYGPGNIREAHTDSEWVEIKALEEAVDGYKRIYSDLAG